MLPVPYIVRRIWIVFLICPSLIICIRGDCGIPRPVPHTQLVNITSGVPGDTITYVCDRSTGYYELPNKSRTVTCQNDNWSTIPVFCARACNVPNRLPYAVPRESDLEKDIYLPGTTVSYNCRPGFVRVPLSGNVVTCHDNLTWSETSDFCKRRPCVNPGETQNGEFQAPDGFVFGSRVTYTCNIGYRMESKKDYQDCQADGTWSNARPTCTVVMCPAPDSPAGGRYSPVKDEYTYQEAVTFSCDGDLNVIGASSASCTSDTTWSASSPTCKAVRCEDPGKVENGKRKSGFVGPYKLNFAVSYECDEGFVMNGSSTITCKINNLWDSQLPKCQRRGGPEVMSCGDPGEVQYATRSGSQFTVGSRVNYRCQDKYTMTSSVSYKECQADGTWSNNEIICKVTCPNPKTDNSKLKLGEKQVYVENDVVVVECNKGFVLSGIERITCTNRGQWEPSPPQCNAACQFQNVPHSHLLSEQKLEYMPDEVVEYECDVAYSMFGSSIITCSSDRQWDHSPPTCHFIIIPVVIVIIIVAAIIACVLCKRSKSKTGEYYCEHKNDIFKQTVEQELTESNDTNRKTKSNTPDVQYTACHDA